MCGAVRERKKIVSPSPLKGAFHAPYLDFQEFFQRFAHYGGVWVAASPDFEAEGGLINKHSKAVDGAEPRWPAVRMSQV